MPPDPAPRPASESADVAAPVAAPDPAASGSRAPLPPGPDAAPDHHVRGRETQEREAARRRGRERRAAAARERPEHADTAPALAQRAFTALAENVRDYAIFLMDRDGVIRYWGEGAHLMKRWAREEAEGAHLRLLYPDGGAEDGTAEDHLREAAAQGESVSEGHRVRGDGSTFWAHITLTALTDDDGALLGFAKVTRDLSAQHAAAAGRALAERTAELDAAHAARTELSAEVAVLQEENAVLRDELRSGDAAGDAAAAPRDRGGHPPRR